MSQGNQHFRCHRFFKVCCRSCSVSFFFDSLKSPRLGRHRYGSKKPSPHTVLTEKGSRWTMFFFYGSEKWARSEHNGFWSTQGLGRELRRWETIVIPRLRARWLNRRGRKGLMFAFLIISREMLGKHPCPSLFYANILQNCLWDLWLLCASLDVKNSNPKQLQRN